ncbi:hypothetical protein OS493_013534 [Desmophyllum pertusum]|uniref:Uncharacterized protein n=1 Tax=Desmophyllum pertusum TaxID=174260 RepID=A0A9X0A2F8_9CNID|nr:hypothetical protein OS493_013534 [Desmophyllum pertusum]
MSRKVLLRETFLDDEKSPVAHAEEKFTLKEVREFEQRHVLGNQFLRNAKEGKERGAPTLSYDRLDEVCVTNLGLNNEQIHNVREKQIAVKQGVLDSRGQEILSEIYMPACRIVTVRQLCEQLACAAVTNSASSTAEWKVKFLDRATCVINPSSQASREMIIPVSIGFCLGLCDFQGNPSAFAKLMMSSYNTGDTITTSCHVAADQRWLSIRVTPQADANDFAQRKDIPVCRPLDENIWRYPASRPNGQKPISKASAFS